MTYDTTPEYRKARRASVAMAARMGPNWTAAPVLLYRWRPGVTCRTVTIMRTDNPRRYHATMRGCDHMFVKDSAAEALETLTEYVRKKAIDALEAISNISQV